MGNSLVYLNQLRQRPTVMPKQDQLIANEVPAHRNSILVTSEIKEIADLFPRESSSAFGESNQNTAATEDASFTQGSHTQRSGAKSFKNS